MNVTVNNMSMWSDEAVQAIVDFLAPCFGHVDLPVKLTIKSRPRAGSWGKAYFPYEGRRVIQNGEWACVVYIGSIPRGAYAASEQYPLTRFYKGRVGKRAGGYVANSLVDEVVHTIAHELRHVEQFEACRLHRLKHRDSYLYFGAAFRRWETTVSGFAYGSCEVDAERVAHGLLAAYKTFVENNLNGRRAA